MAPAASQGCTLPRSESIWPEPGPCRVAGVRPAPVGVGMGGLTFCGAQRLLEQGKHCAMDVVVRGKPVFWRVERVELPCSCRALVTYFPGSLAMRLAGFSIAIKLQWLSHSLAMLWPCYCHIAMLLLGCCPAAVIAMSLPCHCRVVARALPNHRTVLLLQCFIAMLLLSYDHAIAMLCHHHSHIDPHQNNQNP